MAAQHGAEGREGKRAAAERRGGGFHRAASAAAPLVRAAGAGRGFAETKLLAVWPELVGPELAACCRPAQVTFRGRDKGLGATLVLAVDGAFATEIEHRIPELIERVNQVYGYRAVARVRLTQTGGAPAAAAPRHPPERPPAVDAAGGADISGVDDPDLRAALARLGANITHAARARRRPEDPS